ncbi:thiopurine S-methyltransferase [Nitrincola iocasae]|uniref:Thiopurine S-methyltransferase n=1 Tax=Nitrincola iocasae TaxID=2614693 RepID=A0A5J6LEJ4_9GAMM|nr:thiopurine S-methyltransferase [Nitrincola iocasae]QEW06736.1 thiopurine S-methyltransferase [Nitrincola iocasae]
MEHQFWNDRWELNQIGFHQEEINAYLESHWQELGLADNAPVFVPLCGKSLDMLWLREQGHAVLGIELSEMALKQFFSENQLPFTYQQKGDFVCFQTEQMRLLAGDFFNLTADDIAPIDAVYDRASLIALPPEMRVGYARHMARLLPEGAHILLISLEYDDGTLKGPPFCVRQVEVQQLFSKWFDLTLKGRFEGVWAKKKPATEVVYTLTRNSASVEVSAEGTNGSGPV